MNEKFFPRRTLAVIILTILFFSAMQVQGATLGLYGRPEISATITGSDELLPGTDTCLPILLRNHGRDPEIIRDPDILPGTIDPVTAIGVEAELFPGSAPVTVRSTPQMGGDVPAGAEIPLEFCLTTDENAVKGTYYMDLVCTYRYAWASDLLTPESYLYRYREETVHIPLQVKVSELVRLKILSVAGENLYPDRQGTLIVNISNSGRDTGYSSYVSIVPDPSGPVRIIDGTDSIGTFSPGDLVSAHFRLYIEDSVMNGTFPAAITVHYKDSEGSEKESRSIPLGIEVSRGPRFSIISPSPVLAPGQTAGIPLEIKNTGDGPAYRASARVIQTSIITNNDGMISLGTIRPGESAGGTISLTADINAIPKSYALNVEVKYYDVYENLQLSDPMVLEVNVKQPPMFSTLSLSLNPEIPLTIAAVIIIIVYGIYRFRKHRKKERIEQ